MRKTEEEAIDKWKAESSAEALTNTVPPNFVAKARTKEDEQEFGDLNKTPFVIKDTLALGRAPFEIWDIVAQGREDPVPKPASDLATPYQGRACAGQWRNSGLSGYSLPGPAVLASRSGRLIPGPNADDANDS